jgi:hypothetical protein
MRRLKRTILFVFLIFLVSSLVSIQHKGDSVDLGFPLKYYSKSTERNTIGSWELTRVEIGRLFINIGFYTIVGTILAFKFHYKIIKKPKQ